jgi:hypothetical protein
MREIEKEGESSKGKRRGRKFEKPDINGEVSLLDNPHKVESSWEGRQQGQSNCRSYNITFAIIIVTVSNTFFRHVLR